MKAPSLSGLIDKLRQRKKAYAFTFGAGEARNIVLRDLAKFCRAFDPEWRRDAREQARYEGRREVFFRIFQHLHIEPDELARIYRVNVLSDEGDQ